MTSITLTLTGNESVLKAEYFPPIELGDGAYVCGLIDFQTFNSIPNIDERNNQFHYIDTKDIPLPLSAFKYDSSGSKISDITFDNAELSNIDLKLTQSEINQLNGIKCIIIPTGSYEVEHIDNFLKTSLGSDVEFTLKINNNTLRSEIKCSRTIDFAKTNSIGSLLGFSERILDANVLHISDKPINILKVNAVNIECNITTGAYINNKQVHTIHQFFPKVAAGYKIVEVPKNVIYLPVIVKSIHALNIRIVDQDGHLVNFRGETITLRIHIKKINQ